MRYEHEYLEIIILFFSINIEYIVASLFSPLLLSVIQGEVIDIGVHMYYCKLQKNRLLVNEKKEI